MNNQPPGQGTSYVGPITDTARWQDFQYRPNDIFICTPPKCGTTWTQAICAMLVFGKVDHGVHPSQNSPWVDAQFAPIDEYLTLVESQTHRRFLKTHTPLDGIPYFPECTYLVVCRDPRDVYCSNLNHRDNMTDEELAFNVFTSGENSFLDWITRQNEPGGWDKQSLQLLTHFLQTYWDSRGLPNIHLYHYSDMKRDLRSTIASMARALSVEVDDELLDAMTQAASFDYMKKNAENFAPETGRGFWKQTGGFFASGSSGQWRDALSEGDLQTFDARLAELATPEQCQWLLNGGHA